MAKTPLDLLDPSRAQRSDDREATPDGAHPPSWVVHQVERVLHRHLDVITVVGEIASFRPWRNGHWYFDLKDTRAALPCIMKSPLNRRVSFDVEDGMRVVAVGRVALWRPQSKMQLVVTDLRPAGRGALLEALERLKRRLDDEGLFAAERKQPLPRLPHTVGIVTSPQGAAVHDLVALLRERLPDVSVVLSPTRVQGDRASRDIATALRRLDATGRCDVIIVGRGGGSLEDLMSFNMEVVARAIAKCSTPIISSVGHESDHTIADLVADARASTPSHAAALAVPDGDDIAIRLADLQRRLGSSLRQAMSQARLTVERAAAGLTSPRVAVLRAEAQLAHVDERLQRAIDANTLARRRQLAELERCVNAANPQRLLNDRRATLETQRRRLLARSPASRHAKATVALLDRHKDLDRAMADALKDAEARLKNHSVALHALSPLAMLDRGYTTVSGRDGSLRTRAADIHPGEALTVRFADGLVDVKVNDINVKDSEKSD